MSTIEQLLTKFKNSIFSLSQEDILDFNEQDNGPLNNVIARISKHCYGVKLYEEDRKLSVEMFYVNGNQELKGDLIQLDFDDKDYFQLLFRFTNLLADEYEGVEAISAFNTFQTQLRGFVEKLGYFTTTSLELKPYMGKGAVMMSSNKKGIKNIILIDRIDFYRKFFNGTHNFKHKNDSEYVYLMVNNSSGYIKIGTSKNPKYRERTLHSQEPDIAIIALWCCDKKIEKELHETFRNKRVRGEWFNLNLHDLKQIENFMEPYMS